MYILITDIQYIPRNMHTVFALLCFVVVIDGLILSYPSGLPHWHCGNLAIAPVPAKQPWWIWINTSCEFIMNDCITTTKQSTTKPCAYFLGYTVPCSSMESICSTPLTAGCSLKHHCRRQHHNELTREFREMSTPALNQRSCFPSVYKNWKRAGYFD